MNLLLYGNINDLKDLNHPISKIREQKLNKYKYLDDKKRCLLAELLLKEGLKQFNIKEFEYTFNEYGKPYLKDINVFFNISHSKDYVVCIISDEEVGIDIEYKKDIDYSKLIKRFKIEEQNSIHNIDDFYSIWTKKEAYIKMKGEGLRIELNSFDTNNIKEISLLDDYKISVCFKNNKTDEIKIIKYNIN